MDSVLHGIFDVNLIDRKFIDLIESEKSPLFDGLFSALTTSPTVSVRLNPRKANEETLPSWINRTDTVAWEPLGYYLDERPNFTLDPAMHQGVYYVQEASSMIYGEIIRRLSEIEDRKPLRILDSCAAPGGKTTAVLASLPENSAVIANEFDYRRADILRENLDKWGYPEVAVTRGSTEQFSKLKGVFDVIIADVPCSGEGMFRKSEAAVEQWSPQLVTQCSVLQREIISNIYPALSTGGYLIYSTCTFNSEENEKNIDKICEEYDLSPVDFDWPDNWNIQNGIGNRPGCYRLLPHKLKGEGLFVAVLKKEGHLKTREIKMQKNNSQLPRNLASWTDNLIYEKRDDTIWGMTPALAELISILEKKKVRFLTFGTEIGRLAGKNVIPSHSLALSTTLKRGSFPEIEVNKDTALEFLRRNPVVFDSDVAKGYVLLTYNGLPVGFVNNLGNRTNNLMPKEWRIRL